MAKERFALPLRGRGATRPADDEVDGEGEGLGGAVVAVEAGNGLVDDGISDGVPVDGDSRELGFSKLIGDVVTEGDNSDIVRDREPELFKKAGDVGHHEVVEDKDGVWAVGVLEPSFKDAEVRSGHVGGQAESVVSDVWVDSRVEEALHVAAEPEVVGAEDVEHASDSDAFASLGGEVGCRKVAALVMVFGDEVGFEVGKLVLDGDEGAARGGVAEGGEVKVGLFGPRNAAGKVIVSGVLDGAFSAVGVGIDVDEVIAVALEALVEGEEEIFVEGVRVVDESDVRGDSVSRAAFGDDATVWGIFGPAHVDEGLESAADGCAGNVVPATELAFGRQKAAFLHLSFFDQGPERFGYLCVSDPFPDHAASRHNMSIQKKGQFVYMNVIDSSFLLKARCLFGMV